MTLAINFLAEAEAELDEAVAYYNLQRMGLGVDFATEVQAGLARIQQYPHAWQSLGSRLDPTSGVIVSTGFLSALFTPR